MNRRRRQRRVQADRRAVQGDHEPSTLAAELRDLLFAARMTATAADLAVTRLAARLDPTPGATA